MRRSGLAAAAMLALLPASALAAEKVFTLRNGSQISGEILETTPERYVVRVAGGAVTLLRSQVVRVEDAPSSPAPAESTAKAPASPPAARDAKVAPLPPAAPRAPTAAPESASGATATAGDLLDTPGPLANPEAIMAGRALLQDLGGAIAKDLGSRRGLEARVARLETATLVAILATPGDLDPRALAVAARDVEHAGSRARPALVRALLDLSSTGAAPGALVDAIVALQDDSTAAFERALLRRVELASPSAPPRAILDLLATIGTRRSFSPLARLLVGADGDPRGLVSHACRCILDRADDPDPLVLSLRSVLASVGRKTPQVAPVLALFQYGRSPAVVPVLASFLTELDGETPADAGEQAALGGAFAAGYRSLLTIRTDAAIDVVLQATAPSGPPERRLEAINALSTLGLAPSVLRATRDGNSPANLRPVRDRPYVPTKAFLVRLVDMLDQERTPAERRALFAVLRLLTKERLPDDAAAWKQLAEGR